MAFRSVSISSAFATNSVAADDAVSIENAIAENGVKYPGLGETQAVLALQIAPGSTPGAYDFIVEENDTGGSGDTDYSTVLALDENSTTGTTFVNVTVSKKYLRVRVSDATANAGTISADLLLAS